MRLESDSSSPGPLVLSPQALPAGTRVERWRVERSIGGGGNGTVYEVRSRSEGRSYALKLAHAPSDPRFQREARTLHLLRHPGVVRLRAQGIWRAGAAAYPYLVMEYVRGRTLYDWSRTRNPTARHVAGLLAQAAWALDAAHRRQVLHRDFKGENLRVEQRGRLVVLDWGAGWHPRAAPITSAARLPPGTGPYRSPQAILWSMQAPRQAARSEHYLYTVADELYAVGVTFHRLVVEQYPPLVLDKAHAPVTSATLRALNPRVPEPFARWIEGLLAFAPEARPRSAGDLAREVQQAQAHAGPDWDVPLFGWYEGPSTATRTTRDEDTWGPVAPGEEVALIHASALRAARVQHHRMGRWLRRRVFSEVQTQPRTDPAGPLEPRPKGRWLRVAGVLRFVACMAWGLMLLGPPHGAPAPSHPVQQLARTAGPVDTGTPATALPYSTAEPPWPGDAMSTTEPLARCAPRLHRYLLAAFTAASLNACSSTQVRPEPARCPPEALESMRQLGLDLRSRGHIQLDIQQPDDSYQTNYSIVVSDGPITSRLDEPMDRLPANTLFYGRIWTGGEKIQGRYTRVRTPDGSEYPVCFILGNETGMSKYPGSRPGHTRAHPWSNAQVVDHFP
ncbi:serine/threonine-protein kinase [Myxococcus sp. SDU36]|uniref:serine/threonine protein kinase n=1 Tax=Myxococcus sp. SDU36 TaxID=2831967 RepID=UPI0025439916|nr:serine/threonine-protein kinase [Myxococcus sp. SDU36]WIG93882.1 serine/threonine protein kinase [Myxococcus sp. SDU36]